MISDLLNYLFLARLLKLNVNNYPIFLVDNTPLSTPDSTMLTLFFYIAAFTYYGMAINKEKGDAIYWRDNNNKLFNKVLVRLSTMRVFYCYKNGYCMDCIQFFGS